jgi:hypothetical protein
MPEHLTPAKAMSKAHPTTTNKTETHMLSLSRSRSLSLSLSRPCVETPVPLLSFLRIQGDQIWRVYTFCATFYFGRFFLISDIPSQIFSTVIIVGIGFNFDKKWVEQHFFHKLIWSPCIALDTCLRR